MPNNHNRPGQPQGLFLCPKLKIDKTQPAHFAETSWWAMGVPVRAIGATAAVRAGFRALAVALTPMVASDDHAGKPRTQNKTPVQKQGPTKQGWAQCSTTGMV